MDARVRYTKKVIQESFFKLLKQMPVNKITVKGICDLSEINRATFYKYYTDPFDLMRQIENAYLLGMQKLIEKADNTNIIATLTVILTAIKENPETYTLLISENGDNTFINRVITDSYRMKKSDLKTLFPSMTETHQQWMYFFMTQGCISILIDWIKNGMKEEPTEIAQFINKLNNVLQKGLH